MNTITCFTDSKFNSYSDVMSVTNFLGGCTIRVTFNRQPFNKKHPFIFEKLNTYTKYTQKTIIFLYF